VLLVVAFPRMSLAACDEKPPPQSLSGFDDFARAILTEWHVPGLAVGVIQNGETVFLRWLWCQRYQRKHCCHT
jgi:CubicO group peptidase (beta-lactamase class C family)